MAKIARASVPALDEILGDEFPVLDHGWIKVIDYLGDDAAVTQGARLSYGAGTRQVNEDRGLIRYLMNNRHSTPFELACIKLHVKVPIFVARQWFRHRASSFNEYSARYSILDSEFYVPEPDQLAEQSTANKQGRDLVLDPESARKVRAIMIGDACNAFDSYGHMIDPGGINLARELARIGLPLSTYTQFCWMVNLRNLMHFLGLRADSHAQHEIRVYAERLLDIMRLWVPLTAEAFQDYEMDAFRLSGPALRVVRSMLAGNPVAFEASGLSKREWRALMEKLQVGAAA